MILCDPGILLSLRKEVCCLLDEEITLIDWGKANREGPSWKHHPTEWDIAWSVKTTKLNLTRLPETSELVYFTLVDFDYLITKKKVGASEPITLTFWLLLSRIVNFMYFLILQYHYHSLSSMECWPIGWKSSVNNRMDHCVVDILILKRSCTQRFLGYNLLMRTLSQYMTYLYPKFWKAYHECFHLSTCESIWLELNYARGKNDWLVLLWSGCKYG